MSARGDLLWTPTEEQIDRSGLTRYTRWLAPVCSRWTLGPPRCINRSPLIPPSCSVYAGRCRYWRGMGKIIRGLVNCVPLAWLHWGQQCTLSLQTNRRKAVAASMTSYMPAEVHWRFERRTPTHCSRVNR